MVQQQVMDDKIQQVRRRRGRRWPMALAAGLLVLGSSAAAVAQDEPGAGDTPKGAEAGETAVAPLPGDAGEPVEAAVETSEVDASPRRVLWLIEGGPGLEGDEALSTLAVVVMNRLLEGGTDSHAVAMTPSQLEAHLGRQPARGLPPCLLGHRPCQSPTATAMEALGADLLLVGRLARAGASWTLELKMYGPAGNVALERAFEAKDVSRGGKPARPEDGIEEVAATAIREIFKATGSVEIATEPDGAMIQVDGQEIGPSPVVMEVRVGSYEVRATAAGYLDNTQTLKVRAGKRTTAKLSLKSESAQLTVQTEPVEGTVWLDGKELGPTGKPLKVRPGSYQLEVRAEGYKPRTLHVVVDPEDAKMMSLTLESTRPSLTLTGLGEVSTEEIYARGFYGRAGYRYASLTTGLSESTGTLGSKDVTLKKEEINDGVIPIRPEFSFQGAHIDLGYTWENLGLVALSASIYSSGDTSGGTVLDGDRKVDATLGNFTRYEVAPAQITWRHAYENLIPRVEAGLGWAHTSFTAATQEGSADLTRDEFFFAFGIEASYYFESWWFAFASLGVQWDLTHDDSNAEQLLTIGAGLTFENPIKELFGSPSAPPKEVEP